MQRTVQIGIVGDFDASKPSHVATDVAIRHAALALAAAVEVRWVPTETLSAATIAATLAPFDGLWAAPASPYRSPDGMLTAIRYAREQGRPFIGT